MRLSQLILKRASASRSSGRPDTELGTYRRSRYLNAVSAEGFTERLRAFRQGLKENGYVEGENVAIEYRWSENQFDRLNGNISELRDLARPAQLSDAP